MTYDPTKVQRKITNLMSKGHSPSEIAEQLNKDKYTTPRGSKFTPQWVSRNFSNNANNNMAYKRGSANNSSNDTVTLAYATIGILSNKTLSPEDQYASIKNLYRNYF